MAVAYSGGRDSTALLHATLFAAPAIGVKVAALHVHHGLSVHADEWLEHCRAQCNEWAHIGLPIVFDAFRAIGRPGTGESVEDWARKTRHAALHNLALQQGASLVLLAHHRQDQAETFLLQALRGAGPAGLSAMPRMSVRNGIAWSRPWLGRSRDEINAYVARHCLPFIDDESNDDVRFARNRMRDRLWPAMVAAFGQAESALADSAKKAQEAHSCLSELAELDLQRVAINPHRFDIKASFELSNARRSNALRAWLREQLGRPAPASLTTRMLAEMKTSGDARWPIDEGELRAYRGVLCFAAGAGESARSPQRSVTLSVGATGNYPVPDWAGCLRVKESTEGGISLAWLGRVELRPRLGAERFQTQMGRPPRSLKKQYQAAGLPEWKRRGPLLYSGGQLLYVPGLGIDARALALPGQPQASLHWVPYDHGVPGIDVA